MKKERESVRKYEQFPPDRKTKQNNPEVICHMRHHNVRCLQPTVKIAEFRTFVNDETFHLLI